MNAYYYSDNGNQRGPVSYEDLKKAGISKDTLVWKDGFDDWQEAGSVPELIGIFSESAPIVESALQQESSSSADSSVEENGMDELDNTKMFNNAFLFTGRARRLEFWLAYFIFMACMMFPAAMAGAWGDSDALTVIGVIIIFGGIYFFLSEGTRRCHDLGHSGFWMLIPYYILWMLFQDGKVGPNEYTGIIPKVRITKISTKYLPNYESCRTYFLDCCLYCHSFHCKKQKAWTCSHFFHLPFSVADYRSYRCALRKEKAF